MQRKETQCLFFYILSSFGKRLKSELLICILEVQGQWQEAGDSLWIYEASMWKIKQMSLQAVDGSLSRRLRRYYFDVCSNKEFLLQREDQ